MSDLFEDFKKQVDIHITSSEWLTEQTRQLIRESENITEDTPLDVIDDMLQRMDYLEGKLQHESRVSDKIREQFEEFYE